jgi:hypothetical protein
VVAEDDLETAGVGLDGIESGLAVWDGHGGEAAEFEGRFDCEGDGWLIVNDEDRGRNFHIFHNVSTH